VGNHKYVYNVFRFVNPVYDMYTCIFKVNVFTKQAEYVPRIQHVGSQQAPIQPLRPLSALAGAP